jgi:hypothetical protein
MRGNRRRLVLSRAWRLTQSNPGLTEDEKMMGELGVIHLSRVSKETALRMVKALKGFKGLPEGQRIELIQKSVKSCGEECWIEDFDVDEWVEFLDQSGGFEVW